MDLADSQRIGFALESKENAAVAAEWALGESIGSLPPLCGHAVHSRSTYDAFAATCEVLLNNGLREQTTIPIIKQVHLLCVATKEVNVAAAASGADASARLRGVL
jgi:hypothetical protein